MKLLKRHDLGFYYYLNLKFQDYLSSGEQVTRIIFLDRDGVINVDSEEYIREWSQYVFYQGALEALQLLTRSYFLPIIISNQSGINRGILTLESLEEITVNMLEKVETSGGHIAAVCYCPHKPEEGCVCRKPGTRMLEFAVSRVNGDVENAYFVGDKKTDVLTATNFGVTPILIDDKLDNEQIRPLYTELPGYVSSSLLTAVKKIILSP